MTEQKNSPADEQEQQIIQKLEAQKNAVKPSQELLSKVIAQLPTQEEQQSFNTFQKEQRSFAWIRFAIPAAGAVVVIGGIFFVSQLSQSPTKTPSPVATIETTTTPSVQTLVAPIPTEKALSLASLNTEEQQIENEITFDDFFEDELQMQEIDTALAGF